LQVISCISAVKLLNKSINTTNMPKAILTGPSVGEAVLLARAHVSEQLRASRRRQRAQPGQPPAPAPGTASASSDPAPAARHNARAEPDRGPRNSLIRGNYQVASVKQFGATGGWGGNF